LGGLEGSKLPNPHKKTGKSKAQNQNFGVINKEPAIGKLLQTVEKKKSRREKMKIGRDKKKNKTSKREKGKNKKE